MVWRKFVICHAENVLTNVIWHGSKTVIRFILCSWYQYCHILYRALRGGDTRWRIWFRHCATSRKVVGSIRIFHWHNPSGRTMDLGLTQPLTEMSTRNIYWG